MKFTVTKKLYLGFFSILVLLVMVGGISLTVLNDTDEQYEFLIQDRAYKVTLVKDLTNSQKEQIINIRGYLLYNDDEYLERYEEAEKNTLEYFSELDSTTKSATGKEIVGRLEKNIQNYNESMQQIIEAKRNGEEKKALSLAKQARQTALEINEISTELINFQQELMNETFKEIRDKISYTTLIVWILIVGSFIVGGVIAFFIGRSIANPIKLVSQSLKHISDGNLTIEKINVKNRDEIGEMIQYLNNMVEDLRNIVTRVNHSALEVAGQSEELSASSEESAAASQMMAELAQVNATGSEKQLNVINDMTLSMMDMSDSFKQIANSNADMLQATMEAASFIKEGSVTVHTSTKQMNELDLAMTEISQIVNELNQKSNEISYITTIINGIADQTNLLALNAAIEAARAGEAGKGFAVVANEVRILAEQSKVSSAQIAEMIQSIQLGTATAISSIEKGNSIVELSLASTKETLSAFEHIEEAANHVGEQTHTVAAATKQMNTVVQGILLAIEEVQEFAKQAASASSESSAATEEQVATMEQIAASAQSLASLAEKLQSIVSTFKV